MRALVVVFASVFLALACVSAPSPGATCARDADCAASLVCGFGRCRTQCRLNADCPAGQSCLIDPAGIGACSLDTDLGCETGVGRACASGLTCAADHCLRTCASASDCPSDGLCAALPTTSVSVCVDPRTTPDAGPMDIGIGDDMGPSDVGALDVGPQRPTIDELCVGGAFACARIGGSVLCWGNSYKGALGDGSDCGSATIRTTPASVMTQAPAPIDGVDALACGEDFACAHLTSGEVLCWGSDDYGQIGDGNGGGTCVPYATRVHLDATTRLVTSGAVSMSAATHHACVLDASGTAYCWGTNRGVIDPASDPFATMDFATRLDVALVPAGTARVVVLDEGACTLGADRSVRCWGANDAGRIGPNASASVGYDVLPDPPGVFGAAYMQTTPVLVPGPAVVRAVALAGESGCMLDDTNMLTCWGDDSSRELGLLPGGLPDCGGNCAVTPFLIDNAGTRFVDIVSWGGGETTCGRDARAHVQCWGSNGQGNAGDDPSTSVIPIETPPIEVTSASTGMPIVIGSLLAVSSTASCATTPDDHDVLCWGEADDGILGDVGGLLTDYHAHVVGFP